MLNLSLLLALVVTAMAQIEDDPFLHETFPEDFRFGFATASYQIEGAWNVDGKGENIWDEFTHRTPSTIYDNSTGDDACKSYYKYPEDVALLKNMGAQVYRFSLSWSRILPSGRYTQPSDINPKGIEYYNKVIDLLLENNITPMVTIYHWDLPQPLMELGGWMNEGIVEHFTNYADIVYDAFGDRVKEWITFNEPWVICVEGYAGGGMAPGIKYPKEATYQCGHNILKSHAESYRLYYAKYKDEQIGRVGITLDSGYYEPEDPTNVTHVAAAERAQQFKHGWMGSPIVFGKYPDVMVEQVARKSQEEGLSYSRLPTFSQEWSDKLRGSWDFIGLNHYTTSLTRPASGPTQPGWYGDQDTETSFHPDWPDSSAEWLRVVPWGFRKLLIWLKDTYNNPEIVVTENGYSDYPETGVNDWHRVFYFAHYINNMLKAINKDGCNVTAYTAWSLLDNFEWYRGYTQRYGVHYVDFDDDDRPRTPKESAKLLQQIIADRGFPEAFDIPTLPPPHEPPTPPTTEMSPGPEEPTTKSPPTTEMPPGPEEPTTKSPPTTEMPPGPEEPTTKSPPECTTHPDDGGAGMMARSSPISVVLTIFASLFCLTALNR